MKEYFLKMFKYNNWANKVVIEKLKQISNPPDKILELMGHIVLAEKTWLGRIKGSYDNIFWKKISLEEISEQEKVNFNEWTNFLKKIKEDEFESSINYMNSKGNFYKNPVKEILVHLLNHSSYHRAQINLLLRQNNFEPIMIDFIVYTRL